METGETPAPQSLRQQLRQARAAWSRLSAKDKNTYTAVAGAVVAAVYFALLWPLAHQRLTRMEYDLEKQAVREKNAAKQQAAPAAPPPNLGGRNPKEAERELEALHSQLEETRAEVARLHAAFVPLDDTLAMNALKTGLTRLAEAGDMEVLALEHVYLRTEDKDRPPSVELIREAAQGNPFKRPLVVMRARASYRGLMQFLAGLSSLPYVAAPVWSDIAVQVERPAEGRSAGRQWLEVKIRFAV